MLMSIWTQMLMVIGFYYCGSFGRMGYSRSVNAESSSAGYGSRRI